MDHIYPTKDYQEYVISQEVSKLYEALNNDEMPTTFDNIAGILKISNENLNQRSIDLCKNFEDYGDSIAEMDMEKGILNSLPKEVLELNCMKFLKKKDLHFKEIRTKERSIVMPKQPDVVKEQDIEIFKDCVITVRFYDPFKYTPSLKNQPRFHQEFQVLGSNFLTDLRDKIYCQCNFGPFYDISEDPTIESVHDPSFSNPGFFFIHDTFFNDTRNPNNPDYSETVNNWMKKFSYVRDFKKANMQETKFEDLRIRIGYPCVYQHHGACEHLFCITSVDLIDSSDSLHRADYPKLNFLSKRRPILCDVCGKVNASFLVTNCALHVKDPLRACETCFFSFHYIDRETKTCEFKAYRMYPVNPETASSLECENQ